MGVGAGLSMYVVVVQKFTFAISSPDEFLYYSVEARWLGAAAPGKYLVSTLSNAFSKSL